MTGAPVTVAPVQIDALLPQTQCTRCGYSGCAPYAAAIAEGSADINQCPPGGTETIAALAALLQRPVLDLNPSHGRFEAPRVAWINEALCIGCAKCLAPCPVDAIVGAPKYTHTVLVDRCTGCELCIPPCPVDCIELRPASPAVRNDAAANRSRFAAHTNRLHERARAREREIAAKKADLTRKLSTSP